MGFRFNVVQVIKMRQPKLDRDYALIQVYKCWHCYDTYEMMSDIILHIKTEHPQTLKDD